jgi:uncharacterized protein VirK/YbjX
MLVARKLFGSDGAVALRKLRKSFSDETILSAIIEHFKLVQVLNNSGARALMALYPHYANKYVHPYLINCLKKNEKREILKFHHEYIATRLTDSFYEIILRDRPTLWCATIDNNRYEISVSFDEHSNACGDLSLTFHNNNTPIYTLSFTIVPGNLIVCPSREVLLVARIQGARAQISAIRSATRACCRISPPHLLMTAAQSIAVTLDIDTIAGVTNRYLAIKSSEEADFRFNYDTFWETLPFKNKGLTTYQFQVPLPEKRSASSAGGHSKARIERRAFRERVGTSVAAAFDKNFVKGAFYQVDQPIGP